MSWETPLDSNSANELCTSVWNPEKSSGSNEPTNIYKQGIWYPQKSVRTRLATNRPRMRTTPVLPSGRMYDLMTPSLPLSVGTVGSNCDGSPTETFWLRSTMLALASLRALCGAVVVSAATCAAFLKSMPFVSEFATQLFAQLEVRIHVRTSFSCSQPRVFKLPTHRDRLLTSPLRS